MTWCCIQACHIHKYVYLPHEHPEEAPRQGHARSVGIQSLTPEDSVLHTSILYLLVVSMLEATYRMSNYKKRRGKAMRGQQGPNP
jgi:hypothetical protein